MLSLALWELHESTLDSSLELRIQDLTQLDYCFGYLYDCQLDLAQLQLTIGFGNRELAMHNELLIQP